MEPSGWLGSLGGGDFESSKELKRFEGSKLLRGSGVGELCGVSCGSGVSGERSSGLRGSLTVVVGASSQKPVFVSVDVLVYVFVFVESSARKASGFPGLSF